MIIIIGAGIAGVSLARHLSSNDLPYRIFDQRRAWTSQGFGLTLREDTISQLLPLLGLSEAELRTQVAVDRKQGLSNNFMVDVTSGEHFGVGAFKDGYATKDFRSNRDRLRTAIGGSVKIEYGNKLKCFSTTEDGITAEFESGLVVKGDILVAADGVHSKVRSTILPRCVPEDWNGVMINGTHRYQIKDWNTRLAPTVGTSVVYPGFGEQTILAYTVWDVDWDPENGYVEVSWGYSRRRRGPDDPLYVRYGDSSFDKSHVHPCFWEELEQLPKNLVEPFKTVYAEALSSRDPTIQHQLVSLLIPKEDLLAKLQDERVVFIGDAVHDWSNHAGTAANAAIQDAIALGEVLAAKLPLEVLYDQRYPAWQESYEKNGQDFEALHRPKEEWQRLLAEQRAKLGKQEETL